MDHVNVFKGLIWPTSHELVRDGEEFRNKTAAQLHVSMEGFLALEKFISRVFSV